MSWVTVVYVLFVAGAFTGTATLAHVHRLRHQDVEGDS